MEKPKVRIYFNSREVKYVSVTKIFEGTTEAYEICNTLAMWDRFENYCLPNKRSLFRFWNHYSILNHTNLQNIPYENKI